VQEQTLFLCNEKMMAARLQQITWLQPTTVCGE